MIRGFAYLLLGFGVLASVDAARDEMRGVAGAWAPTRSRTMHTASEVEQPELFRGLMTYQWGRAVAPVAAGFMLLGLARRADRVDPFSSSFAGAKALDELHDKLSEEQEKARRPFRH